MAKLKDTRVYGNLDIDSVLTVSSDTTINGNLTVTGNTIYSYVDTMKITDPLIELGGAESGSLANDDGKDRGSLLHYYSGAAKDAFMGWDNSAGEFALGSNVTVSDEVVTFNEYGNLHAGKFIGNGAGLTHIAGANVDGTVAYANMSSYAGIVTASSQPNIHSVGTLTDLTVSGDITAQSNVNVTGDSSVGGDLTVAGNASVTGDLTVTGTIHAAVSGTLTAPGSTTQVLFNDAGTVNAVSGFTFNKSTHALTVSGNVSGDTIIGNAFSGNANGLSHIYGPNVSGYVPDADHATIANIANLAYAVDGSNVSGEVSVANTVSNATQSNITTVGTLTVLNVDGDIWGGSNISVDGDATIGGALDVTGDISGANGSFSGTLSVTGNASTGNLSTGIVTASGNVDAANFNTSGTANIGNLKISGKTEGNLIPSANVTYNLGNATNRWKDLYLSGSSIYLGDQVIESNSTSLITTADMAAGNLRATNNTYSGNVYANSGLIKGSQLEGTIVAASASQPNITQVGTLVNVTVTGNAAVGGILTDNYYYANGAPVDFQQAAGSNSQIQFNLNGDFGADASLTFTASNKTLGVGNLSATGNVAATGTVSGGNVSTTGNVAATGTVSGGNVTATGNVSAANVVATGDVSAATANVTGQLDAGNVVTLSVTSSSGNLTLSGQGTDANVILAPTGNGTVSVSNKIISDVATPSATTDAATKGYVDSVAQGLSVKDAVLAATSTALANSPTYNNGTNGEGATLTATTNGVLMVDAHAVSVGDRVLVKNQVNKNENGVYVVTNVGTVSSHWVLTRATDLNSLTEALGAFVFVEAGTTNHTTGWVVKTSPDDLVDFGVDDLEWTQFSGAGTYTAASGVQLDGTVFSAKVDNSTIDINGSGEIHVKDGLTLVTPNIGAATGTSLDLVGDLSAGGNIDIDGNITANNITGTFYGTFTGTVDATVGAAGSNTEIQFNDAGNIAANAQFTYNKVTDTLGVGNISAGGNVTVTGNISASKITGTLTTAAQPNITSVGTLTSLAVTGNVTAGNVTVSTGTIEGQFLKGDGYQIGNIDGASVVSEVANAAYATNAGTADWASNVYGSDVSGDVAGADHANIADVANSVAGSNVTGFVANATNATYVTNSNQSNITQVGTLVSLAVTGNVTAGGIKTDNYYYANGATVDFNTAAGNAGEIQFKGAGSDLAASANFKFNSSTNVLTVTGNVSVSDTLSAANVSATLLTGTLTTAAQPNVTSLGTLTGLTVDGVSDLGDVGNVAISGGTSGQYLQTDGTGSLSWSTINTSQISNGTSNVAIPTSNGNVLINVNGSQIIKVSGVGANVTGVLDVSGNVTANNVTAANVIAANGNVAADSAITGTVKVAGGMSATGNIYTGKAVGFANNNGGTDSAAYIQFNASANSLDFIFN